MPELKPCPFCGGMTKVVQCDDEGNVRGEEYESNPWSGLGYRIVHESDDCPIYTCEDGYNLIYDSREEAENHWNTRAERTCHPFVSPDGAGWYAIGCSNCGHGFADNNPDKAYLLRISKRSDIMPRYCPNCGAKVVENEVTPTPL